MPRSLPGAKARSVEVMRSGREKAAFPGLGNLGMDAIPQVFYTTLLSWGSLATRSTTFPAVPYNFTIVDIFTVLKTAPVDTGTNRIRVGTATDDDLFFVTGNLVAFTSSSVVTKGSSQTRHTSATNALGLATRGLSGMQLKFTLPPVAAVTTTDGEVFGVLVVVPR